MSNIRASVVADSINQFGNRITTVMVTFPRIILAETNTHRALSRNSASSRAIPFRKMVETIFGEMNMRFTPIAWQKDHTGMQGTEYFTEPKKVERLEKIWDTAAKNALASAVALSDEGVTKQLCNRLLEPFMWHTVLITATEWENFFYLRCPKYQIPNMAEGEEFHETKFRSRKDLIRAMETSTKGNYSGSIEAAMELSEEEWLETNEGQAEIHMMALAEAIWDAKNESKPTELKEGEWHIPFASMMDIKDDLVHEEALPGFPLNEVYDKLRLKIATARCARVSYTVAGALGVMSPSLDKEIELHNRLASSGHWSPFEHCAKAMSKKEYFGWSSGKQNVFQEESGDLFLPETYVTGEWGEESAGSPIFGWCGNFRGFVQYRKTFNNENVV